MGVCDSDLSVRRSVTLHAHHMMIMRSERNQLWVPGGTGNNIQSHMY